MSEIITEMITKVFVPMVIGTIYFGFMLAVNLVRCYQRKLVEAANRGETVVIDGREYVVVSAAEYREMIEGRAEAE